MSLRHFDLSQSLSAARANQRIGATVDFAVASERTDQPLHFILKKGRLNGCVVSVYSLSGSGEQLLEEIRHYGAVKSDPDHNPLVFNVDLRALKRFSPIMKRIERGADPKMLWAFYYPWYHASELDESPASKITLSCPTLHPVKALDIIRQIEQAHRTPVLMVSSHLGGDRGAKRRPKLEDPFGERPNKEDSMSPSILKPCIEVSPEIRMRSFPVGSLTSLQRIVTTLRT